MIYRLYPLILGISSALLTVGGFLLVLLVTSYRWPLVIVPFVAPIGGFIVMSLVAARFPRIRYVDAAEIDGLGHLHQPVGVMGLVFLWGLGTALRVIFRG